MIKRMICIECPKGCGLSADIENCKVKSVDGAECPKGLSYAVAETESPSRILTSTVLADGLTLKLVPVRTDKPIPKKDIFRAAEAVRRIRIKGVLKAGDAVVENFLGLGVKLVATREVTDTP